MADVFGMGGQYMFSKYKQAAKQFCATKWHHTWTRLFVLSSPKGLRAESARAVTGRRNSHRWEGGRLFEPSAGFFYGNSCNFGTKSRKIVSKVGN